jgi:hypothetical protein
MVGVFEIAVKMAFLAWEAAVLPLNYARSFNALQLARENPRHYCGTEIAN